MALGHTRPCSADETNCPDCVQAETEMNQEPDTKPDNFFANTGTRLYEIGRTGAFDISIDPRAESQHYASIHPSRPDLDAYFDTQRNLKWMAEAFAAIIILVMGIMLISTRVADFFHNLAMTILFWAGSPLQSGACSAWSKGYPGPPLAGTSPCVHRRNQRMANSGDPPACTGYEPALFVVFVAEDEK